MRDWLYEHRFVLAAAVLTLGGIGILLYTLWSALQNFQP
jgi:hypothetical protein